MTPEDFPRMFAKAFATQDTPALMALLSDDAQVVTLTGAHAENVAEAKGLFDREFSGTFANVRLVSGKTHMSALGPGGAVLHQRYVVIGAQDPNGQELPRFAALLIAVLLARSNGWQATSLSISALSE